MATEAKYTLYTVQLGDTLSKICEKTGIENESDLIKMNGWPEKVKDPVNPDVEKNFELDDSYYGKQIIADNKWLEDANKTPNTTVSVQTFILLNKTQREMFVNWTWPIDKQKNTQSFKVVWKYYTSDGWLLGSDTSVSCEVKDKEDDPFESRYTAPEDALAVKVKIKPLYKEDNNGDNGGWGYTGEDLYIYHFSNNMPSTPSAPNVKIDRFTITAELNGISNNSTADHIEFALFKVSDKSNMIEKKLVPVVRYQDSDALYSTGYASTTFAVEAGFKYIVLCRGANIRTTGFYGSWSEASSEISAPPAKPTLISSSVRLNNVGDHVLDITFNKIENADSYTYQYSENIEYFSNANGEISSGTIEAKSLIYNGDGTISYSIQGIPKGKTYYIRINSTTEDSNEPSEWSNILQFIIGTTPTAPTTWSSVNSAVIGDPIYLYWNHNSEDESAQSYAKLFLEINGTTISWSNISNDGLLNDSKIYIPAYTGKDLYNTRVCTIKTSNHFFKEGAKIRWWVKTAGVLKDNNGNPLYGDESIVREINIYAKPTINLSLVDNEGEQIVGTIKSLPFSIRVSSGSNNNQKPTGYHITIQNGGNSYTTVDNFGLDKTVSSNEILYSKNFDSSNDTLEVEISANDVTLIDNMIYNITCVASMDSGLMAENSFNGVTVDMKESKFIPYAAVEIDKETISAYIRPYCSNKTDDILLSVYRREYDGSFTEIAYDMPNTQKTYYQDPHPSLDYARYRIVAKSKATGIVHYNDIESVKVGESSIIIQWDEAWQNFDVTDDELSEKITKTVSMVKLPYNISISENNSPDVSLVNYIGRKNPVSYYGTQLGTTASWSTVIPKEDKETLYVLRRLSIWMGDVYVREPSGIGYWANIKVSLSRSYDSLTIPVSFDITRVEGGM